jgi:hypothetical protein
MVPFLETYQVVLDGGQVGEYFGIPAVMGEGLDLPSSEPCFLAFAFLDYLNADLVVEVAQARQLMEEALW